MIHSRSLVAILVLGLTSTLAAAPCGDADGGGSVDIVDSLVIAQCAAGLTPRCVMDLAAADTNGSGHLDITDALAVAQDAVGGGTSSMQCEAEPGPGAARIYVADQHTPLLTVIDAASRQVVSEIPLPSLAVCVAADPVRPRVYVKVSDLGMVLVVDTRFDALAGSFEVPGLNSCIWVSPDGRVLVGHSYAELPDRTTLLYDLEERRPHATLASGQKFQHCRMDMVDFSNDGATLYQAYLHVGPYYVIERSIQVVDLASGLELQRLDDHGLGVMNDLAVDRDGGLQLLGYNRPTDQAWQTRLSTETGLPVRQSVLAAGQTLPSGVTPCEVEILGDGTLALAGRDLIEMRDATTWQTLGVLQITGFHLSDLTGTDLGYTLGLTCTNELAITDTTLSASFEIVPLPRPVHTFAVAGTR